MFCKYCGTTCETGVCPDCAAKQAQAKVQAQPSGNLHLILVAVAALALIWGILNVFSVFHVNACVSRMDITQHNYISVSDAALAAKIYGSSVATIYIGNILFGLTNLVVAAVGALYFLKVTQYKPFYDQFIGSKIKFRPAFLMGIVGAVGALLQVIMYLFCGTSLSAMGLKMSYSFGVNWTTWVLLVAFVGLAVLDKVYLEKKNM